MRGVCVGEDPIACEATTSCSTPGMCDRSTGLCSSPTLVANDLPCELDDGGDGRCDGGRCLGFPIVSLGFDHSCTITPVGKVVCWGANTYGQLGRGEDADNVAVGDGSGPSVSAAGYLPNVDGARAVATGADGTCIISTTGGVRCWGSGLYSSNGVNTDSRILRPPTADLSLADGFATVTAVSRVGHTCALSDTGRISCWGALNGLGEHGNGTSTPPRTVPELRAANDVTPVRFGAADTAQALVTGLTFRFILTNSGPVHGGITCAVIDSRGVTCWGDNEYGQLGVGDTLARGGTPESIPALVAPAWPTFGPGRDPRPIVSLCAGASHACAIQEGVGLRCWGDNTQGQLGYTDVASIGAVDVPLDYPPVPLGLGRVPLSVGCGLSFTCVLMESGEVVCFGSNTNGRLGLGLSAEVRPNTRNRGPADLEPVRLGARVHSLAVGYRHSCAVTVGGIIRCWGHNGSGRLGVGHTNDIGDAPSEMPPAPVVLP